jgi:hypothetical protein
MNKCECGFIPLIEWENDETERNIPCGACYWEEWVYNESIGETEKISHGNIIHCVKGEGI